MGDPVTILGEWRNQNGSRLTIHEAQGARFSGRFRSQKGRAARDREYAVHGVQNGEILAFTVSFDDGRENLHAISNFSGRVARDPDGREVIHTLWVLTRQFEDEHRTKPTQVWNSFIVNSDLFARVTGSE